MENAKKLAIRFRAVILDGLWIANSNYKTQLSDISWEEATTKIASLNTIAALSFHINYYIAGVLNVFEGGSLDIRDKYSFDMPPIESKEAWENLVYTLLENAEKFAKKIEQMPDEQLAADFVDAKYGTYQRNIEGMIEHSYYHLGQISLIKKMIREN